MAKSIFERMGLVERVEDEPEDIVLGEEYYPETEEEVVEVDVDNVSEDNFIADIYTANELSDLSKSIFKVEEISKNLPNTMPKDTMQASVIGILASFQLTPADVIADGERRQEIIKAAQEKINDENAEIITAKQMEIEEAKKLIESCEKEIAECKRTNDSTLNKAKNELTRIQGLIEFVTVNPVVKEENK